MIWLCLLFSTSFYLSNTRTDWIWPDRICLVLLVIIHVDIGHIWSPLSAIVYRDLSGSMFQLGVFIMIDRYVLDISYSDTQVSISIVAKCMSNRNRSYEFIKVHTLVLDIIFTSPGFLVAVWCPCICIYDNIIECKLLAKVWYEDKNHFVVNTMKYDNAILKSHTGDVCIATPQIELFQCLRESRCIICFVYPSTIQREYQRVGYSAASNVETYCWMASDGW